MDKFNRVSTKFRQEKGIVDFIEVGTQEARFIQPLAAAITNEWKNELTSVYNAHNITPSQSEFATMTFNTWLRDRRIDKPVIIAAPPAFGKSAMMSMFLRVMCANFPDTFGAVVVKERLDDLKELRDEINEACGIKRAYLIEGYDKEVHSRLDYEDQFVNQREYNVLLMTTKQLERQSLRDNLESFTSFETDAGKLQRRSLLLIDEKPSLVLSHTLSARNLNEFMSDVLEISRDNKGKLKSYYNRVRQIVEEVRAKLEGQEIEAGAFPAVDRRFKMPVRLVRDFAEAYGHEQMATLRAVERVINTGGEYSEYNGIGIVTNTHTIHYKYTLFNTYILDGTGATDPEYLSDDFYVVKPQDELDYSNVLFRVCDSYNLSRTALRQSAQSVERVIEMAKRIITEHESDKTLVVTYKENVEQITEELSEEIAEGKAMVKHFDGGRGSNDYVECNNAIYIGTLFKGTSYYTTASQAVVGDRLGMQLKRGHISTSEGLTFKDEYTEAYKKTDIAINLVQETNRLRAGRKPDMVTIYLFNRDKEMVDIVRDHYPLAKFEKYEPIEKLTGKKTAIDEIIDYFAGMDRGERVKQSTIYKELDISSRTFRRQVDTPKFRAAMKKYGITREKTFYQKD
ncbi:hypothetical protein ACFFIS_04785 [Virgibacillus soli]